MLRDITKAFLIALVIVAGCVLVTAIFMFGVDVLHDRFGGIGVVVWGFVWMTVIVTGVVYTRMMDK